MPIELTPRRMWAARIIALLADAIQVGAFPLFAQGVASPLNDVLDVIVAVAMVSLVGWHWAFLPTLVAESIPMFDLVPSWTAAVFIATRHGATPAVPVSVSAVSQELPQPRRELPAGGPGSEPERGGGAKP